MMRQNRVREALGKIYDEQPPHFREYLQRFQEDPTSRVFAPLAETYRRMGRVDDAIGICKTGLEHHPEFHGGRVALAKCYIDKKMYQDAKRELELVVADAPENLLAQRLLADMHLALQDKASAIHSYKMALLLSPGDVALSQKIYELEKQLEQTTQVIPAVPVKQVEPTVPVTRTVSARAVEPVKEVMPFFETVKDSEEDFVISEAHSHIDRDEEIGRDPEQERKINALLGMEEDEVDPFQIQRFGQAFGETEREKNNEITTQTLADLYLSQGQYAPALEMFSRIYKTRPSADLRKKVERCRKHLGVDEKSIVRQRQIEFLRGVLRNNLAHKKAHDLT